MDKEEFYKNFLYDFDDGLYDKEVHDVSEFRMGYIPFIVKRKSDGQVFKLNEDNMTYSMPGENPHVGNKWSWGRFFRDTRCVGQFEELAWCRYDNIDEIRSNIVLF